MTTLTSSAPAVRPELLEIRKILVPLDFSPSSREAFRYAIRLARQFGSELTLVHVLDAAPASCADLREIPAFSAAKLVEAENKMKASVATAFSSGIAEIDWVFRIGPPVTEILEAAKEFDADLIVIATDGDGGRRRSSAGSTADRVVRAAPCPVLLVREKQHPLD